MSTPTDEFTAWFEAPEQAELRLSCSKGWAELIWQASRAAVVIEIPTEVDRAHFNDESMSNGYNYAVDDCREAIEAAGVGVK